MKLCDYQNEYRNDERACWNVKHLEYNYKHQ
jgi:hypothetical protein